MAHRDDAVFAEAGDDLANLVWTSVIGAFFGAVNVAGALGAIPGTGSFMPSLKSITKLAHVTVVGAIGTISAAVYNAADSVMSWLTTLPTLSCPGSLQ